MHPLLALAVLSAAAVPNPAHVDSVLWLPFLYDAGYDHPNAAPAWSPDGEQLAFTYSSYTPPQYYRHTLEVLQRDGAWHHCPLRGGLGDNPASAAWSPRGDEIVANQYRQVGVFAADRCDSIRELAAGYDPKWSPDGQRIMFWADVPVRGIYTAAAAGGDIRLVIADGAAADWSPDGRAVVFARAGSLWTVGIDGTNELQITQSGHDERPAWSRDGLYVAFNRTDPNLQLTGVWLVAANGGPATEVTPRVPGETRKGPCWSPDGSRLTYFVLDWARYRVGIGMMQATVPTAVQSRTWSAVKTHFR